jgi:hypothetical protein
MSTSSRNSNKTFSFLSSHTLPLTYSQCLERSQRWTLKCSLKKGMCDGKWKWPAKWRYWLPCTYDALCSNADWSFHWTLHMCCVLFAQGVVVVCFIS